LNNLRSNITQSRWEKVGFAMAEDDIHFLPSFRGPLKSEALRSTRKNTAFAESSNAFVRKVQNVRLRHFTGGSDNPQESTLMKQEKKDGGLATVR